MVLTVDFFLGAVYFARWSEERAVRDSARGDAVAALEGLGVRIAPEAIPEDIGGMGVYQAVNDVGAERAPLSAILGEMETEEQGGGGLFYQGSAGWARKRPAGSLELSIENPAEIPGGLGKTGEKERLLSAAGIAGEREDKDFNTVKVSQLLGGYMLFNCSLEFYYNESGLDSVSGRWIFSAFAETGEGAAQTSEGCILEFVKSLKAQGRPCTEISEVRPGYVAQQFGSIITAWPVIRVRCDTGEFFWNIIMADIMEVY